MASSPPRVERSAVDPNVSTNNALSKLKTYGFAIAIILSLGGLVVGSMGVTGYFHVGSLSNLSQVDAIIMMATGWGTVLIIGIIGLIKNCTKSASEGIRFDIHSSNAIEQNQAGTTNETHSQAVYGGESWKCWNIKVVGEVPEMPPIDWEEEHQLIPGQSLKETCIAVYFPPEIEVNGKKQNLSLKPFENHPLVDFNVMSESSYKILFETPIEPGWKLVTKQVITNSRGMKHSDQKALFTGTAYRMPKANEMVLSILMHHAHTKEKIFGGSPITLTRCEELINGGHSSFTVGNFGFGDREKTLLVSSWKADSDADMFGVAAVRDL